MFELPLSGLKVDNQELLHFGGESEQLIASHPLDQITEIELYKRYNYYAILFCFLFVLGLAISGHYIENLIFLWIVRGILVSFLLIAFLAVDKIYLKIRFGEEEEVSFNLSDSWDRCASFTIALRRKWKEVIKESKGGYD